MVFILTYPMKGFTFDTFFYRDDEIQSLVKSGKSLIRYGDGEINILLNLRNHYQDYSPVLKRMLREIVQKYRKDSPYVLGVPTAIRMTNAELRRINRFQVWLPFKVMFLLRFNTHVPYFDAHSFYRDRYFERVIAPVIREKNIILITKAETILFQRSNELFPWKDFPAIETPKEGLLPNYARVMEDIERVVQKYDPGDVVMLVAMGPVGKHIMRLYAERGYQSIDLGIGAEVMFTDTSIEHVI